MTDPKPNFLETGDYQAIWREQAEPGQRTGREGLWSETGDTPPLHLCRGRRVYGQTYRYDCDWIGCPILYADDECMYHTTDPPNPNDEPQPDA